MKQIEELIERLEAIAKANEDDFRYMIAIDVGRREISYRFVATETADGHEFLVGQGPTVDSAVLKAANNVEEAVDYWGYVEREQPNDD